MGLTIPSGNHLPGSLKVETKPLTSKLTNHTRENNTNQPFNETAHSASNQAPYFGSLKTGHSIERLPGSSAARDLCTVILPTAVSY